jgi:hypothetical protein
VRDNLGALDALEALTPDVKRRIDELFR